MPTPHLARFAPSAMALATASLIAACGGGGGGTTPPVVVPTQIKGVVASGAALGGASVIAIDSDATTTDPAAVTAAADGSYTINVTGLKAPLVIQATATVEGVVTRILAVVPTLTAEADNTANVTPLTNAVAALIAPGGNPTALLTPATLATSATTTNVANANALLVNTLNTDASIASALGANFNPLTTAFVANGTGVDGVLDKLALEVSAAGVAITNLAAPLTGAGVQQAVVLTAAQTATPAMVVPLPASATAADLPTAAEIAALGAKFQACMALPVASRVTLNTVGTVTAVSTTCNFAPAGWKSNGRNWLEELGQFTFAKNHFTGASVGKGLVVLTVAPDNLTDPKEFKHPQCNTTTCVVVRYPLTTPGGQVTASDWLLGKVGGVWDFVGNQRPYRGFVEARLVRKINANRDGAAAGNTGDPYFFKDRFESTLRLAFDLRVGNTSNVRAVRITGPGLPAAGVVMFRSQRCATDDRMGITYQNGSTRQHTNNANFVLWTGASGTDFVLDAANLDGTPLAMPTPVLNATTASFQDFSPAAVANQSAVIPAWSRYKIEIFHHDELADVPDEIVYTRISSAAENAALGVGKPWPTLASSFVDAYLKPTGTAAGAVSSLATAMSWAAAAGTYIGSSYLFGQNFATVSNSQGESANHAHRARLDFEPAVLGNTSATGLEFAGVASGASLSTFTQNSGTNPNPRCTSTDLVPLTANTSDYREAGLSFRGSDRKLYQSIWLWDN